MTADETPARRTALVLGGGGNLGAVQVGFIRRMDELGIAVDFVVGTSVGSLNATYLAFHDDPGHDCLREIWAGLGGRRLFHRSIVRIALNLLRTRMSLYDDSFVRELIRQHLTRDDFAAARLPLYITATSLRTGARRIFREGSIVQAVLASTAIPGLLPPVRIGDDLFVDGAVSDPTDIDAAIELGATDVIAIDLSHGLAHRTPTNIMDVISRSFEVFAERRAACALEHAGHQANVAFIRPGLDAENSSHFDEVDWMMEQSYSMARAVFEQCWDGEKLVPGNYQLAVPRGG